MINWVYFVLIAQGIWSITSLIDKIVISRGYIKNPLVYIVLNGLTNVLLIFMLPFVGFEMLSTSNLIILLLSGVTFSAAITFYYKAVQYDEISRVTVLYQLGPIFVLVLSYLLLDEILTRYSFIGLLFLISAGLIISYKKSGQKFRLSITFYLMLLSAFLSSVSLVSAKHIFNVTGFWSAFLWLRISGFTALLVLLFPSIRKQFVETFRLMNNKIRKLLGLKIIIDFSAFIFAGYALKQGQAPLVSGLASSVLPLFVFIVALFTSLYFPKIVKEEIDKKAILTKLLAIALIIVGIIFVNM